MKKFLLLLMTLVLAALGAKAAITISSASVTVGGTTFQGYSIEGAMEGELAQLLNGNYNGTVLWNNGATLDLLKSAEYIKVGTSSNPNVLGDADLMALDLLSGAKYLDIDGSVLADGADITKIEAGPAIEAVTLPGGLTKDQVNTVGGILKTCNANFGSCLCLNGEMEEKTLTTYTYTVPCSSEVVEYTGTVTESGGNYTGSIGPITRDVTLLSNNSTFSYENTKFPGDVITLTEEQVRNTDGTYKTTWTPESLKVALTQNAVLAYSYNNQIYKPNGTDGGVWWLDPDGRVNSNYSGIAGLKEGDYLTNASSYTYTYQFWNGNYDGPTYTCPAEDVKEREDGAYYCELANPDNHYSFPINANYAYSYSYVGTDCDVVIVEDSPTYPGETIDIEYDQDIILTATTLTIHVPKEGGDVEAIAYVNKAGTLYKATSLDANDVAKVTDLVISGHINNGDISWYGADSNDIAFTDDDSFESNGATVALVNWNKAPKSVDIGDAEIDEYQHLRVLRKYGKDLKRVVLPKTATRIPNNCFVSSQGDGCYNLEEVVFPTDVPFTIGDNALKGTAIKNLVLPSGVTDVGDYAFATCPKLYTVEMEGLDDECTFGDYVFNQCSALQHVSLSEGVQNIGDYMFNQCVILESIRIPSTCSTIGSYAFQFCYDIHQVTIPEGVELIKLNAFEGAGITDIYLMATTPAKLPKIYAMSPTGAGPSTFSYQRTTGNNTVPDDQGHLSRIGTADYDEVLTWYQEEQSGSEGLGSGNCLTALHYPESMKDFFEGIDYSKFPNLDLTGVDNYKTLDEYLALVGDNDKVNTECILKNKLKINGAVSNTQAREFKDEDGNPIEYKYLSQSYSIDPDGPTNNDILLVGPDKDGRYYPIQECYLARMAAGATGVNSGGQDDIASAWGWRQFPLSSSIESIGETPFEKEYDDTWYTMAFPWRMIDNQLFAAFNQQMEIVEFVGAELLEDESSSTETVKAYNLVFHFDKVAKTYYMDHEDNFYNREIETTRQITSNGVTINKKFYEYTLLDGKDGNETTTVITDPYPYNAESATPAQREMHIKYLSIENIMVLAGHPYMIHPSIGASPGNPVKVYINGVKKIEPGKGLYTDYSSFADVAEANKVSKTVSSRTRTKKDEDGNITYEYSGPEVWTNPDTGASGGQYYFIGNINDEVKTVDETSGKETSDHGAQDMPLPSYFLGVIEGQKYPKYYKKTSGGIGKWSQYSAIIRPDGTALANVESLYLNKVNSPTGGLAKGANIELGAWDFDDSHIINEHAITTIIEEALEKDPATPIVHMNVVYNIKGEMVRSDSSSIEGLPKGIYIVNGKKYLVK